MKLPIARNLIRSAKLSPGLLLLVMSPLGGQSDKAPGTAPASGQTTAASPVLRANTHLVTVDVVVTDHHGKIVPDLTAKDFEVYEQVAGKKGQQEEKISQFEFVTQPPPSATPKPEPKIPAGVYTNLITTRKLPVPATVLLVDGLNTDMDTSMQARRQMVKMLAQIPPDTPVAVFLLGRNLTLLQGFTKDPNLLKIAASKALSLENAGNTTMDARDDPSSLSSMTLEMFGGGGSEDAAQGQGSLPTGTAPAAAPTGPPGGELQLAAIERFEKETIAANTDMRVQTTLDALRAIARHLSGYGGRKNLIWISSSFPIAITTDATAHHNLGFEGTANYTDRIVSVTNALADAKVAVYPVNPSGVQTQAFFDVSTRRSTTYGPTANQQKNSLNRENEARFSAEQSMKEVAEQTGGKVCVDNNDLADCVKIAVTEGSSYYELAYHPDAADWHGEFHKIVVKASAPGAQLSFRQGYFARADEVVASKEDKHGNDPQLEEAACGDLLTATSVLVVARAYPPDQPGEVKYFMVIDSKMLTFPPTDAGAHQLNLDLAVCTLDRNRKPLQFLQDHVRQELSDKEYPSVASHGVTHVVQFLPKSETATVRLVVRDAASGRLGSLDIPYPPPAEPAVKSSLAAPAVTR